MSNHSGWFIEWLYSYVSIRICMHLFKKRNHHVNAVRIFSSVYVCSECFNLWLLFVLKREDLVRGGYSLLTSWLIRIDLICPRTQLRISFFSFYPNRCKLRLLFSSQTIMKSVIPSCESPKQGDSIRHYLIRVSLENNQSFRLTSIC